METPQQLTLHVPLYVWPLVAVLLMAWIYVMLPERFKRRSKAQGSNYVQLERLAADIAPAPAAVPAAKAAVPAAPKWTLDVLRALSPEQLNSLARGFWLARGCTIEPAGNDLLIFRPSTGRLFAIAHCTAATPQKVSVDQMQSLWEFVQQRAAPLGLYYGIAGFTDEAIAFAKDKHVKLLSGSDFLEEIGHLKPEQQQSLLQRALERPLAAAA
jgi:hypothetical protein